MGVTSGLAGNSRQIQVEPQIRFPGLSPLAPTPSAAKSGVIAPPPLFRPKNINTFTLLLTTAQASADGLLVAKGGALVWYVNSTAATDVVFVRLDDQNNSRIPLSPGQSFLGFPFQKLYFDWAAQAGSTATILISDAFADEAIRLT